MTFQVVSGPDNVAPVDLVESNGSPTSGNWQDALTLLLESIGFHDDKISEQSTLPEMAKWLRGQGFDLNYAPLVDGGMPMQPSILGYILELHDGSWLSVKGNNDHAVLLNSAEGKAIEHVPLDKAASAWLLSESVFSLNSIAPFLRRYKSYFIDLFIAGIFINLFALVLPLFSSFVYDKILGNGIVETMWALVIGIMIIIGIEFSIRVLRVVIAERFSVNSEVEIDRITFQNLLNTSTNKMPSIGGLLEKYKRVLSYRDFLSSSYILALADIPFLLLFLFAIVLVSGPLVLVAIICGTLMLLASIISTPSILEYDKKSRIAGESRFGLMADILSSREAIIGSAFRDRLSERWRQASVATVQAASKSRYWRTLGMTITSSISYISFIGVLVGGVYMVEDRQLTSGGLLAASMLTSRSMATFASAITLMLRYREFSTALRELNQIVPASAHKTPSKSHGQLQGAVRFHNVTCCLRRGDRPVLKDINLNIRPGEIVGIAGSPGAGKTTLLRLLAGVLEPDDGRILIDNIPLNDLSPKDISHTIGFKPQDLCLLDGTVEENIRAGRPPMSIETRRDVLITSGLIHIFEEGTLHWTSEVGARGSSLSGGQRQLLSLARTFLSRPPLILLDEPTNGLDSPLEAYLAKQLLQMRGDSTILVSTHSRNILSICDRIVVIGQSRILADGPRDKILL